MKTLQKIVLGISLLFCSCSFNIEQKDYILKRDGNYPGIVVFAYNEEPMVKEEINRMFNELKEGSTPTDGYKVGIIV
jgi:hypothetical protein